MTDTGSDVDALDGSRLVIETATRRTVVAVGVGPRVRAAIVVDAPDRHGTRILSQLSDVLDAAGIGMDAVGAIGVGTGPGSFTGLRVGLAAAKTLAALRHLPVVGIPTDEALRRAAAAVIGAQLAAEAVIILPAGAHDHYLGMPGSDPSLVPPGTDLAARAVGHPVIAVDVRSDAEWLPRMRDAVRLAGWPSPSALGDEACAGLPGALLALLDQRLAAGERADAATLVPRYVALPRGIAAATAGAADGPDAMLAVEGTWSPGSH